MNENINIDLEKQEEPKILITPDKKNIDAITAAILSFIFPGLGQGINGQLAKGVIMFFVGIPVFIILLMVFGCLTCGLGFLLFPIYNIFSAFDAYFCTKKLEEGKCLELFEINIKENKPME